MANLASHLRMSDMNKIASPTLVPTLRRGNGTFPRRSVGTRSMLLPCYSALCALGWTLSLAPAGDAKVGPDKKTWDLVAQKAAKFLHGTQDKNGGRSTDKSPS